MSTRNTHDLQMASEKVQLIVVKLVTAFQIPSLTATQGILRIRDESAFLAVQRQ